MIPRCTWEYNYVDDIVIAGSDKTSIERVKKQLAAKFDIKDLGDLSYFLGENTSWTLSQVSLFRLCMGMWVYAAHPKTLRCFTPGF